MARIGLIGGSGLERLNFLESIDEVTVKTVYGDPSSSFFHGQAGQHEIFILSRHNRDHSIPPTHVNNRGNIEALRQLGCEYILATTACGSLREVIRRGDLVIPDQFIDFTYHRISTFHDTFEPGKLFHSAMADPFSPVLRQALINSARELGLPFHPGGTVITIEGPRFSTRAESRMFRVFGADIVNMSI